MAVSGKTGWFLHNSVNYTASTWSISLEGNPVDVTSFQSSGWKQFIAGVAGGRISVEGFYNNGDAQLVQNDTLTNATLGIGGGYKMTILSSIVSSVRYSTDVTGAGKFALEVLTTGAINTSFT